MININYKDPSLPRIFVLKFKASKLYLPFRKIAERVIYIIESPKGQSESHTNTHTRARVYIVI
jgi:hypothetical protein